MEICHLCSQAVSKLAKDLLVPGIVLHVHLGLYLGIVYHYGTKLLAVFCCVKGGTRLPAREIIDDAWCQYLEG